MMAGNLLNFAEYEREMIKARVSAANEDYLAEGSLRRRPGSVRI